MKAAGAPIAAAAYLYLVSTPGGEVTISHR
jgi:hypothetical protein